jgi:hypothetical protein
MITFSSLAGCASLAAIAGAVASNSLWTVPSRFSFLCPVPLRSSASQYDTPCSSSTQAYVSTVLITITHSPPFNYIYSWQQVSTWIVPVFISIVPNHCLRTQNQQELRVNRGHSRLPRSSTKLVGRTQSSPVKSSTMFVSYKSSHWRSSIPYSCWSQRFTICICVWVLITVQLQLLISCCFSYAGLFVLFSLLLPFKSPVLTCFFQQNAFEDAIVDDAGNLLF